MRDRYVEELGSGVSAPIGNGQDMTQPMGNANDLRLAFKDLSSSLEDGLSGPTGPNVLNAIVNAVMADPQVPSAVKQSIRRKVEERWSHVVDLSNSPPGQGPGLGNISGNMPNQPRPDPSMNNVIVPNPSDSMGIR